MARALITGSADGLGLMVAQRLAGEGHAVTLHARSEARAEDARRACPKMERVLVGDLASLAETRALAAAANATGRYDAVIHNAAVGYTIGRRTETVDGLEQHFQINVLAPYVLTASMTPPSRLVYLSSGMHRGGTPDLSDAQWKTRRWNGSQAYSDTKLYDTTLAFAIARRWPTVLSNSVSPRVGRDEDGRRRRPGRSAGGARHAGVARGQRRRGSKGDGSAPLSPEAGGRASCRARRAFPGGAPRVLRVVERHAAADGMRDSST